MRADSHSHDGSVVHEILKIATIHKADLIVIGTHGRRGVHRLLLGSTAEEVLRHASCPVLTVGPGSREVSSQEWRPREIVCATGLEPKLAPVAAYAYKMATDLESKFTLFHVEDPSRLECADDWQKFAAAFDRCFPEEESRGDSASSGFFAEYVARDIVTAARNRGADLIVLAAEHAPFGSTHLFRGMVPQVLGGAPCPVLTLRAW